MEKKHDKKRVFLSVREKMAIVEQSEKGVPTKVLCRKYGVSTSVIYRAQRECTLLSSFGSRGGHTLWHKNRRTSPYEELESRLYTWFLEQQVMGNPLTDVLLQEKAMELSGQFASTSFTASGGWLRNFKNRYRIRLDGVRGEKGSTDDGGAKAFVDAFTKRIEEEKFNLCNIYNMYEMGLLWKTVPSKTLISEKEGILTGIKKKKNRVSIGLCANADGTHKLSPLFIHKFKSPRVLTNCEPLPVVYKSEPQACINLQIFNEWYEEEFKPSVRQYQLANGIVGKVLLLVDDCSSHKTVNICQEDDNFEIVYLPANTTSLIRPMDQGIIEKLKTNYRQKIMRRILQLEKGLGEFYDKYNIKDCIYLLNESWNDITAANIKNGWNKCLSMHSGEEEENLLSTSTHSQMNAMTHTITGEENSPEDFMEILWHLEGEEKIRTEDVGKDIREEEENTNMQIKRVEEEGNESLHEAGSSHEAGLPHKVEFSFIEEKMKFLSIMEDGLKKFAKNNQTLLIMGEALLSCLENEAPRIKKNHS